MTNILLIEIHLNSHFSQTQLVLEIFCKFNKIIWLVKTTANSYMLTKTIGKILLTNSDLKRNFLLNLLVLNNSKIWLNYIFYCDKKIFCKLNKIIWPKEQNIGKKHKVYY